VNSSLSRSEPKNELDLVTGIMTFNYALTSPDLISETYTFNPSFTTIQEITMPDGDPAYMAYHHYGQSYSITLNSDHDSTLLQHMHDIESLHITDAEHDTTFTEMQSFMQSMNSTMYAEMDLVNSQATLISDLQLELANLKTLIGDNTDDTDNTNTNLTVPVISDFTYTANGDNSVTLDWIISEDQEPITHYSLMYKIESEQWIYETLDGTITSYTISDLQNVEYVFSFKAQNEIGFSKPITFDIIP